MKITKEFEDLLTWYIDPKIRTHCGPLFFAKSLDELTGDTISNNATFGLIKLGELNLLVTCHHVWEGFNQIRKTIPHLHFGLCIDLGKPVIIPNMAEYKMDDDKRCDLVVFNMQEFLPLFHSAGLEFYNLNSNPIPTSIEIGQTVYLIGYPGKGRKEENNQLGLVRQPLALIVTEVGEFNFFADVEGIDKLSEDVGGISGAPCFAVSQGLGNVVKFKLIGFTKGISDFKFRRLQFTYAHFIKPDGVIRYMS